MVYFVLEQAVRERIMQFPSRATTLQETERMNEQRSAAENESMQLRKAIEVQQGSFL